MYRFLGEVVKVTPQTEGIPRNCWSPYFQRYLWRVGCKHIVNVKPLTVFVESSKDRIVVITRQCCSDSGPHSMYIFLVLQFGPTRVLMSRKKKGKALVAFTNHQDAVS